MDLVVSPAIVGFNNQSGGNGQVLAPGQLIDALVLQLLDATTVRLSVAGTTVDVKTKVPLEQGAAVRLAVRGHGNETRLVIVGQGNAGQDGTAQSGESTEPGGVLRSYTSTTSQAAADAGEAASLTQANGTSQAVPASALRDIDPATALANATRAAAARQTGLAPLFAEAAAALDAPGVPPDVRQAATQLLALRAPFDQGVSASAIQKAIGSAGVFLEARLAATTRGQATPNAIVPSVTAEDIKLDIKAVLFTLREALKGWLDSAQGGISENTNSSSLPSAARPDAMMLLAKTRVADASTPPPPYRNAPTSGQQPATAVVPSDAPARLIGNALLEETDGALARTTLLQAASLPGAPSAVAEHADAGATHWNLEVPFVTLQGTAIAHFEILRDNHKAAAAERKPPGWRVNFSIDVEPMGPVHAQVSLSGHRTAVRLWAERGPTATALRNSVGELGAALKQAEIEPAEVVVRDGAPPRPLKPGAGQFLDRAS